MLESGDEVVIRLMPRPFPVVKATLILADDDLPDASVTVNAFTAFSHCDSVHSPVQCIGLGATFQAADSGPHVS
jgi:hypothetical protein